MLVLRHAKLKKILIQGLYLFSIESMTLDEQIRVVMQLLLLVPTANNVWYILNGLVDQLTYIFWLFLKFLFLRDI